MGERRAPALPVRDVTGRTAVRGNLTDATKRVPWKLVAVVAWIAFSVALAIWWLIFGLRQIEALSQLTEQTSSLLTKNLAEELARQQRMLMSEGLTLVVLLLAGGAALLYYINTEIRRARKIQEFFAAFTHDLKTSLASVRLQAESLEEDLQGAGQSRLARRLVKDTVRLELQLENSLLLASPDAEERLLIEPLELEPVLESMRHHWPDLEIKIDGEGTVRVDQRALESILKNLLQNSVVHGRAEKVSFDISREGRWIRVRMEDNGRGFKGDVTKLGRMFMRHGSTSGSGLGLYLAMSLAKRMQGDLIIRDGAQGFVAEVLLPAAIEAPLSASDGATRTPSGRNDA